VMQIESQEIIDERPESATSHKNTVVSFFN